jgi:hypothetical protein
MQRLMRSILVALLVAMLTISPATACHYCGGYGGGGYYYTSGDYGGDCGGCGSGYSESSYDSCCGGEVVVSEGCGDCGGGCEGCEGGCEGCSGCETEGVVEDHAEPPMEAPEPPVHEHESTPSTVNRMPSEPAPSLPPEAMPSAPPTETYVAPPVEPAPLPETTTPPVTQPAFESTPPVESTPPATEPATDDLFSTPATDSAPLPVEEPATPSEAGEADDFFSEPATDGTTESAPATDPVTEPVTTPPATEPTDDDLFAPPAEDAPAEETPPAEESTETDDLFSKAGTILNQPGGLSSHSLRHWVDNTGKFTCNGRMLRMLDGKVQLLKDNGRTTTVPLARLSHGDLEFVNRQASAQKAETLGKTAQVSGAWSN